MKRLTDLRHDVKNVQDNVLGDLDWYTRRRGEAEGRDAAATSADP